MKFPEQFRWPLDSEPGDPFGLFRIVRGGEFWRDLKVIACDGKETGWEHVSVSVVNKPGLPPSWREMVGVKNLFWDEDQWVVQFHPAKADYVNNHEGCLHLWHCCAGFPTPPKELV